MKCGYDCPALWVQGGGSYEYPNEVDCWGCKIFGMYEGSEGDSCYLTKEQIEKRLNQLEDYYLGKIERPKWVENRFMHDMDDSTDLNLPSFPPKRTYGKKTIDEMTGEEVIVVNEKHIYGSSDLYWEKCRAYEQGYKDAVEGKKNDAHGHYGPKKKYEDPFISGGEE